MINNLIDSTINTLSGWLSGYGFHLTWKFIDINIVIVLDKL